MVENLTGQVVKGYELRELLGEGGFGAVYLAFQNLIGRDVAVKIILPQYANQPDFVRRFETEAQLIARLEHPHIVPLYDYWREASGAYLVMRFLRGGSLHKFVLDKGPVTPQQASDVMSQVASALAVAHRNGIIHRDIKPENILLDEDGNAYLSDFGIAKDTGGARDAVTQNNAIVGSPAYISPEQIRGEPVTPLADIYTMGLMLYEILTGVHPFGDYTAAALMYKHLTEQIPDVRESHPAIPPAINMIIQRATAKDPKARYQDVLMLASDLRRAVRGESSGDARKSDSISGTLAIPEPENPYKGLRAFQQADAADFYGRASLTDKLLERMQQDHPAKRFLAVVGPSGSGKSSVVKAGLIPALYDGRIPGSDRWFIVEMVPGIDPMEELEAALLRIAVNPPDSLMSQLSEDERGLLRAVKRVLPDDGSELLLVIDQFEELFTLVEEEDKRTHMMASLLTAVTDTRSQIRVIITLRADFYDRPLNYVRFGELMQQRTEIVLPLNAEEIEQAVVGPAEHAGLFLEPGLVTAIVTDVNEQPGALPLLQYALTELFERRDGRALTMAAYNAIGGTLGALAQRADELYDSLGEDGEETARQMFLRLVTLGEGAEDTRRRVMLPELLSLGDKETMQLVIDAFGRYRLLTFDRDPQTRGATVEVAHEALIRQWKRLRDWLSASREDLRLQRRLTSAAQDWRESRSDPSFLARGARLEQFEAWVASSGLVMNAEEKQYLDASIAEREKRLADEKARQEREEALEQRSRQVLRALVVVFAFATVIGLLLSALAFTQRQEAEAAREEAVTNAEEAERQRLQAESARTLAERAAAQAEALALAANARNALIENTPGLSLALAIEADRAYSPSSLEINRVLANAAYAPGFRYRLAGHTGSVVGVALDPAHDIAASAAMDGTVRLWNVTSGETLHTLSAENAIFTAVAINPAGDVVAAASSALAEDGSVIPGGSVQLWDVESGELLRELRADDADMAHSDMVMSLDFNADGSQLLSGSLDRTLRVWDGATGALLNTIGGGEDEDNYVGSILRVAFSADGTQALSAHGDQTILNIGDDIVDRSVRVWDVATGEQVQRIVPNSGFVRAATFSPDGARVVVGTWDSANSGTLRTYDIASGDEVQRIYSHSDIVTAVQYSMDGTRLISASWDSTLRVWDVRTGLRLVSLEDFEDRILAIAPGNGVVMAASGNVGNNELTPARDNPRDTSVWVVDLVNRATERTYTGHGDWVWESELSADGTRFVSGSGALRPPSPDASARVWDVATGAQISMYSGHTSTVDGVAFHPDGARVMSGDWDSNVVLWDAATGEEVLRFAGSEGQIIDVALSPDGQTAAAASSSTMVYVWDVETGALRHTLAGHSAAVNYVTFSPDSARLLSGGQDNMILMWDVATGEQVRRFGGHTAQVSGLAFSPDGTLIASGAWDNTLRLWDAVTGVEIRQYPGHTGRVLTVNFSPDAALLVSGSSDGTVRLWDVRTTEEIRRFEGHTNWVSSVDFMPDGLRALSSAQDNTLRLWRIDRTSEELLAWAQANRYLRGLTCTEQQQYHVDLNEQCAPG